MLTALLFLTVAPVTHAQSALDDIKSHLEGEGIEVVDYSAPTSQWGSIPSALAEVLRTNGGFSDLKALAENDVWKDLFIGNEGLVSLRRQLALAEAQKTQLYNEDGSLKSQQEIDANQALIDSLKGTDPVNNPGEIRLQEDIIKSEIPQYLGSAANETNVNIVFREIDFYYNYVKWGRLPSRIIALLEGAGYKNLKEIADLMNLAEDDEDILFFNLEDLLSDIEGLSSDDISLIEDSIQILSATGESQINQVARTVANTIKNIVIGIALIWIIYAGARMVFAQGDETVITEQKRSLIYAGVGLISILLVDRGIDFLYGPAGVTRTELVQDQGFTNEIYGLVNFIKAIVGALAILFISISGVKSLFATGKEDELTKQKASLLWVGVGLILIAIDKIIIEQIFIIPISQRDQIRTNNITTIINTIGSIIQFLLGFVGLVAFGALIYGAATMVMNYGNDEMVEKSKKIIRNAIIGIVVILSAYVIVSTLVVFR